MNRETLELLFFGGMGLIASYQLMRVYRAYLNAILSRASGEPWRDVWKRAYAEHVLNRQAELHMFGSKWATFGGHLLVTGVVMLWVLCVAYVPVAALLLALYLAWGLYATCSLEVTTHDVYVRLLKRDRIAYHLLHAVLWPLHNTQTKNPSISKESMTMNHELFSRTGVRYEVALDVLGAIIAHHSEAIAAERRKAIPDETAIAAAQKAKDELRTIREELDPDADEAIERVIAQYGQQARELYQ